MNDGTFAALVEIVRNVEALAPAKSEKIKFTASWMKQNLDHAAEGGSWTAFSVPISRTYRRSIQNIVANALDSLRHLRSCYSVRAFRFYRPQQDTSEGPRRSQP